METKTKKNLVWTFLLAVLVAFILVMTGLVQDAYSDAKNIQKMDKLTRQIEDSEAENAELENARLQAAENLRVSQLAKTEDVDASSEDIKAGQSVQLEAINDLQAQVNRQEKREIEQISSNPKCVQEEFVNSQGVAFKGCKQPLSGDQYSGEWKRWEDALKDGDLCIYVDPITREESARAAGEC